MSSLLDADQVIKLVADEPNEALRVNVVASVAGGGALPVGASTAAKQDTGNASLASIDAKITTCNTGAVVISSGTVAVSNFPATQPISGTVAVSSSALPAGAATSAKQDTANTSLSAIDGKIVAVNTGAVVVSSSALPAGAATSAKQDTQSTSLASIDGKIVAVNTGAVVIASGSVTANEVGFVSANAPFYNDYTVTPITSAAYVELVASTTTTTQEIEIFDSSGFFLYLATGAAAAEVNQIIISPGGNGRVKLKINAGSRVSAKAISTSATAGALSINFYG